MKKHTTSSRGKRGITRAADLALKWGVPVQMCSALVRMALSHNLVVLLSGPPGSGKSTLTRNMQSVFPNGTFMSVPMSKVLDAYFNSGALDAQSVETCRTEMRIGNLVPDKIVSAALRWHTNGLREQPRILFLDGAVRTAEQIGPVVSYAASTKTSLAVVDLFAPKNVCIHRAISRPEAELREDTVHINNRIEKYHALTVPAVKQLREHMPERCLTVSTMKRTQGRVLRRVVRHMLSVPGYRASDYESILAQQ